MKDSNIVNLPLEKCDHTCLEWEVIMSFRISSFPLLRQTTVHRVVQNDQVPPALIYNQGLEREGMRETRNDSANVTAQSACLPTLLIAVIFHSAVNLMVGTKEITSPVWVNQEKVRLSELVMFKSLLNEGNYFQKQLLILSNQILLKNTLPTNYRKAVPMSHNFCPWEIFLTCAAECRKFSYVSLWEEFNPKLSKYLAERKYCEPEIFIR